jgi:hypothetical protein
MNKLLLFILFAILFISCKQDFDSYYFSETETSVNTDILSLLKQNAEYSQYVALLEKYKVDSLLKKGKVYTFFVPTNTAIEKLQLGLLGEKELVDFLMTESFINLNQIEGQKKIQTQGGKFAIIERGSTGFTLDGIAIIKGSPLANNGRFYEIADVVQPKPNLYEYIAATNEFYLSYLKSRDSVYLDKELSKPVGYTNDGLTIYDTVLTKVNLFEELYFPVSQELRDNKATMLLFTQEQYDNALNTISSDLGISTTNIPKFWQNEILMPYLIEQSVFRNALPFTIFAAGKAKNILGDSVLVTPKNITPDFYECSNGRVYKLIDFKVPEKLYRMNDSTAMLNLVYSKGSNLWAWNNDVVLTGQKFNPVRSPISTAVFKSTLLVDMGKSFAGSFSMAYKHKNIFPATYKLTLRANVSKTAVYNIFVNGKQYPIDIKDGKGPQLNFDFFDLRNGVISSVTNKYYPYKDNFCSFDILIDNITTFGDVEVKLVYVKASPRNLNNCGLNLDFISLDFFKK